ncbi:MAG: hypothetical protein DRJ07_13160 [Bacteroidetes bacterium]|nr:MAG: hypothetical protein DRJ07_13160 [Bacteroidota bacterium]
MDRQKLAIIIIIFFSNVCFVYSQNNTSIFIDSTDNALDLSTFLTKQKGVLPVIVPITEPAVGYGAIGGALYFIPKSDPKQRPDIIAAAVGITSNGTWLAGGGYVGFWNKDKIRYRGVAGYGEIALDYYLKDSKSLSINLNTFVFLQQANFRIGKSDFFLGVKYQLTKVTIPIFEESELIDSFDLESVNSGISVITEFDNLNNFLSPTKGTRVHLSYNQNLETLGSTRNWGKLNFFTHIYYPVNKKWIPALRVESSLATGKPPFYAKPFVYLRGVPALRYQGDLIMLAETEQLFNLSPRWGILGFTGIARAFDSIENMNSDEIVWNAGGGFRYLIARALGLKVGADIARGPEEWAFYITIGTAWLK